MYQFLTVSDWLKKEEWCKRNGWSDLQYAQGKWYAFPPNSNSVIPQEIPYSLCERLQYAVEIFSILLLCFGTVLLICLASFIGSI